MKYKPGDWIILGPAGSGWGPHLVGKRAQIADIGPHLKGRLIFASYDFYVLPNKEVGSLEQICDPKGGGYSGKIAGLAKKQAKLENVFKL